LSFSEGVLGKRSQKIVRKRKKEGRDCIKRGKGRGYTSWFEKRKRQFPLKGKKRRGAEIEEGRPPSCVRCLGRKKGGCK